MTFGSPPKWLFQNSFERMTATSCGGGGGAFAAGGVLGCGGGGIASSSLKSRPSTTLAPSTRSRFGVTNPSLICSGSP